MALEVALQFAEHSRLHCLFPATEIALRFCAQRPRCAVLFAGLAPFANGIDAANDTTKQSLGLRPCHVRCPRTAVTSYRDHPLVASMPITESVIDPVHLPPRSEALHFGIPNPP